MKSGRIVPVTHLRARIGLVAVSLGLTGCAGLYCPKAAVPEPLPPYAVSISAEPGSAAVFLGEKPLGATPMETRLGSLTELSKLTARQGNDVALEQRIQVLSETDFKVIFRFSTEPSAVAKRLGLTRVLVFDFSDKFMFDFGKADLKAGSLPVLAKQAQVLRDSFIGVRVFVCGHTDSIGSDEANISLSLKRAQAVAEQLEVNGLLKERMNVLGLGKEFPVENNETDEGRAANRRTELVLPR